jgi:regulator of RNase E activity RraA
LAGRDVAAPSIDLARRGDVLVVQADDDEMAVAGGNVCAIAPRNGVAGLVVDDVIRDVVESREHRFPVFARGASPIPARRVGDGGMNIQIRCGGVVVNPGDVVVADEEGIVVPRARADELPSAPPSSPRGSFPPGAGPRLSPGRLTVGRARAAQTQQNTLRWNPRSEK